MPEINRLVGCVRPSVCRADICDKRVWFVLLRGARVAAAANENVAGRTGVDGGIANLRNSARIWMLGGSFSQYTVYFEEALLALYIAYTCTQNEFN